MKKITKVLLIGGSVATIGAGVYFTTAALTHIWPFHGSHNTPVTPVDPSSSQDSTPQPIPGTDETYYTINGVMYDALSGIKLSAKRINGSKEDFSLKSVKCFALSGDKDSKQYDVLASCYDTNNVERFLTITFGKNKENSNAKTFGSYVEDKKGDVVWTNSADKGVFDILKNLSVTNVEVSSQFLTPIAVDEGKSLHREINLGTNKEMFDKIYTIAVSPLSKETKQEETVIEEINDFGINEYKETVTTEKTQYSLSVVNVGLVNGKYKAYQQELYCDKEALNNYISDVKAYDEQTSSSTQERVILEEEAFAVKAKNTLQFDIFNSDVVKLGDITELKVDSSLITSHYSDASSSYSSDPTM